LTAIGGELTSFARWVCIGIKAARLDGMAKGILGRERRTTVHMEEMGFSNSCRFGRINSSDFAGPYAKWVNS
jgi:hypothetical protein